MKKKASRPTLKQELQARQKFVESIINFTRSLFENKEPKGLKRLAGFSFYWDQGSATETLTVWYHPGLPAPIESQQVLSVVWNVRSFRQYRVDLFSESPEWQNVMKKLMKEGADGYRKRIIAEQRKGWKRRLRESRPGIKELARREKEAALLGLTDEARRLAFLPSD